jgi:uncharacterized protein
MIAVLYFFLAWAIWLLGIPFINIILRNLGLVKKRKTGFSVELIVILWGLICLLAASGLYLATGRTSSIDAYQKEISLFREELNNKFADPANSPLSDEDISSFSGLDFFPVRPAYCVEARFVMNPVPEIFEMETTTSRRPLYLKYGEVYFNIGGRDHMLEVYRPTDARKDLSVQQHLFLPFRDLTNGVETYGGGRFLDLQIPAGETLTVDFNKAYNPYCAYNHKYSCPVPPMVNHLDIEIPAGEKNFRSRTGKSADVF